MTFSCNHTRSESDTPYLRTDSTFTIIPARASAVRLYEYQNFPVVITTEPEKKKRKPGTLKDNPG